MSMLKIGIITLLIFSCSISLYYYYPEETLPKGIVIDNLVVIKSERKLLTYSQGRLIKIYKIALGRNPIGNKKIKGDNKTPEGIYLISGKNYHEEFYKYLYISYPNSSDVAEARLLGKPAGGDILLHGSKKNYEVLGKFNRWVDWTAGCIAVLNYEMDELYSAVNIGTKIEIKP